MSAILKLFLVKQNGHCSRTYSVSLASNSCRVSTAGLLTSAGGAIGGAFLHGPLGAMIGLLAGTGETIGSRVAGRGLLDYVVNHPVTWAVLKAADVAAPSKGAEVTSTALKKAAVASVNQKPSPDQQERDLRNVYAGAAHSLGGS